MKKHDRSEKTEARSEGMRLLRAAGTIAEIARETQLSDRSIGSFRGGSADPGNEARRKIAIAYPNIAPPTWDRPATTYKDPPWLDDALRRLTDYPAAAAALIRAAVAEAGDETELREHDGHEAALQASTYSAVEPLRLAAVAAELRLAEALDAIDGPRVKVA